MQKEATCLRCDFKKSFYSQKGNKEMFVFIVQFDNGDNGEFVTSKNPQDYFTINQRAKYLFEARDGYPPNIKAIRENNFGGGNRGGGSRETPQEREMKNRQIVAQSSVKAAVELISSGKVGASLLAVTAKKIFDITYSISEGDSVEQIDHKFRKENYLKSV